MISLKGEYKLDALAMAGANAGELIVRDMQRLGPADAEGFHSLSAEGSF
jgi:hypothetical protein